MEINIVLKRKIEDELLKWKNDPLKKSLIVNGPRQVGKSYSIRKFGKEHYSNFIEINFKERPSLKSAFSNDLTINTIIQMLSILDPTFNFIPNKTLLFLDEIQECPEARTALKFFTIDKQYDVIASGSLLGLQYNSKKKISYPVGYVNHISMKSLDFEEFLWAIGFSMDFNSVISPYFESKSIVPNNIHNALLNHIKKYIIVGGMPEAVIYYVTTNNYNLVRKVQQDILKEYRDDIANYSSNSNKNKIRDIFDSIFVQLSKENKMFKYTLRPSEYFDCITWLIDAGFVNICYNISTPIPPLSVNIKKNEFKIYLKDTGLLMAMIEESAALQIINGQLGVYKGAIYENLVSQLLYNNDIPLYFHTFYLNTKRYEIDFVLANLQENLLIEVKAKNSTSHSLLRALEKYPNCQGYKFIGGNTGAGINFYSLPFYMILLLKNYNN